MKKKKAMALAIVVTISVISARTANAVAPGDEVIPGGRAVGIRMEADGMVVSGFTEETESPAKKAGLEIGDRIIALGGETIVTGEDFRTAMERSEGAEVEVHAVRGGEEKTFSVTPQMGENGWQLGLWLRSGLSGIGTLTFCDPDTGLYGALGHGVSLPENGELMVITGGEIYRTAVADVQHGTLGTPGELQGEVISDEPLGSIESNTIQGIFGHGNGALAAGDRIVVASDEEITLGAATILATVNGEETREYSVEITRVSRDGSDTRQLALDVTDEALLSAAGGIVQGMSGSPILQNGKLIGAVTHVLLSDPTKGYGISMENMLRAAADIAA